MSMFECSDSDDDCDYDDDYHHHDHEDKHYLLKNHRQVAMAMVLMSIQRRLYNSYLEVKFHDISTTIIVTTMIATTVTTIIDTDRQRFTTVI